MCTYPTLNFQTLYPKHTYSFIWPEVTDLLKVMSPVHMFVPIWQVFLKYISILVTDNSLLQILNPLYTSDS